MHTPGPWRQVGAYIASANERVVARIAPPADAVVMWADTPAGLETAANAALIAAAPELLEALNLINVDSDGDGFICREAMDQVRAAIAKATGQP